MDNIEKSDPEISITFKSVFSEKIHKSDLFNSIELTSLKEKIYSSLQNYLINTAKFSRSFILDEKNFSDFFFFRLLIDKDLEYKEFEIENLDCCSFFPSLCSDITIMIEDVFNRTEFLKKMNLKANKLGFSFLDTKKIKHIIVPVVLNWDHNKENNRPFLAANKNFVNSLTKTLRCGGMYWPKNIIECLNTNIEEKITIDGTAIELPEENYIMDLFSVTRNVGFSSLETTKLHLRNVEKFEVFDKNVNILKLLEPHSKYMEFKIETLAHANWSNTFMDKYEPIYTLSTAKRNLGCLNKEFEFLCAFESGNDDELKKLVVDNYGDRAVYNKLFMEIYNQYNTKKLDTFQTEYLQTLLPLVKSQVVENISALSEKIPLLENMFKTPQIFIAKFKIYMIGRDPKLPKLFIDDLIQTGYICSNENGPQFKSPFFVKQKDSESLFQ